MSRPSRDGQSDHPTRDSRFGVPDQRSRHANTARIALVLALCLATLTIVAASGFRLTHADASSGIEQASGEQR
jgi:hypothetical protein